MTNERRGIQKRTFPTDIKRIRGNDGYDGEDRARVLLERWYAAPIWGDLQSRRPSEHSAMIERRLEFGLRRRTRDGSCAAGDIARACLALSVARQADLWPVLRSLSRRKRFPIVYVAGAKDPRYGWVGDSDGASRAGAPDTRISAWEGSASPYLREGTSIHECTTRRACPKGEVKGTAQRRFREADRDEGSWASRYVPPPPKSPLHRSVVESIAAACPDVHVAILPNCGHALPTEAPDALFEEVSRLAAATTAHVATTYVDPAVDMNRQGAEIPVSDATVLVEPGGGIMQETQSVVTITNFILEEFTIPMTAPLQLSACRLTERRGVLIKLEGVVTISSQEAIARASESCTSVRRVYGVGETTPLPGEECSHHVQV